MGEGALRYQGYCSYIKIHIRYRPIYIHYIKVWEEYSIESTLSFSSHPGFLDIL